MSGTRDKFSLVEIEVQMASKPWNINLLSLDQTEYFETTLWATSAFLRTFNAIQKTNRVEVSLELSTSDADEIAEGIFSETDILHIMSHAESGGVASGGQKYWKYFTYSQTYDPTDLAEFIDEYESYPEVECLIFDACESASVEWVKRLSDVVPAGRNMILIGTTRKVRIDETLVYTMAFYQELLRKVRPKALGARGDRYESAHQAATHIFKRLMRKKCPFVLKKVTSRRRH